jgi:hypothetical protein
MANHLDKCEANQMDSTNNQAACASVRLSQDAHCDRQPLVSAGAPRPELEPDHKFHCLNLIFFKIGFKDHSLAVDVNLGVVKADVQLGQETRADGGVHLGPLGAHGGAGFGFNRYGLHGDVGGRVQAAKLVDTGAEFRAKLGPQTSIHADTGAKVLFGHTRQTFDSSVGEEGLNNSYKGDVGLAKVVGVQAGGHANLNDNSSVGGNVKTTLQDASLGAGADVSSKGNTVVNPDVYIDADSGQERARYDVGAQVGPKLDVRAGTGYDTTDRNNNQHAGDISFGVGQSGIGVQTTETLNGQQTTAKAGIGPDYMSDF